MVSPYQCFLYETVAPQLSTEFGGEGLRGCVGGGGQRVGWWTGRCSVWSV